VSADYIFNPKEIVSLVKDIHISDDLSAFKGHAVMPRENVGPSGAKFRCLVAELNSQLGSDYSYLEIGIYLARTVLTSAVESPEVKHIGVDNFSQFDPDGRNSKIVYNGIKSLGVKNVEIVEDDFIRYFLSLGRKPARNVGVFFYDAIHDYRSQLIGLMQGSRVVPPGGIILVDDTNYAHVRYSTYDFIEANPDFKLLFETFTYMHPAKMAPEVAKAARDAWWNGTQVIMYDPADRANGLGVTRDADTDARFARAVSQTPADCPGLPTLFAEQD